jgi:hypothetical protein
MEPRILPPTKQEVYAIAAAIQRESGDRLIAVPCEDGNGVAVCNGDAIWFVGLTEISTPEAIHAQVARWLGINSAVGTSSQQWRQGPQLNHA